MIQRERRYSREEIARRGQEVYARVVRPTLSEADVGKFVEVDIESEDYEMDADVIKAAHRLLARRPGAQLWLERVGYVAAHTVSGTLPRRPEL
jgi:hypothetical protein